MNSPRPFLRPFWLCIGIVMTGAVAWWLAGPSDRPRLPQENLGSKPVSERSAEESRGRSTMAGSPATVLDASVPAEALPEISLGLHEQHLLRDATLLQQRRVEARERELARQVRLWRTAFKYPLIREEVWLRRDAQGRDVPVRREFSVADHVLVKFPQGVTEAAKESWVQKQGFVFRHRLQTTPVCLVATPEGRLDSADQIMAAFRRGFPEAEAAVAERDYVVFPTLLPDDSSFSQLWGLHNTGQTGGVADADIDAPEAWDLGTGSREVLVGVIDTGVDRRHPDLITNMWTNPGEVAGNGVDDDGNGFIDDVNGWDFFAQDNDPMDENNHGTHCSGTIGGVGGNRSGVTGVCWQVSMVGIRFLGPNGGTTSDAIESVNYATRLGVDLTSNSWGGGGFSSLLQAAIANAGAAGQLFVAAAGNEATNTDFSPQYPAGYAVDTIVAVAASTDRDERSSFSNYGRSSVDLAAPGSAIYSTIRQGGYASFNGTSMATPHVAGALALLKSIVPSMTAMEMKSQLLATVDPRSAFASTTLSGGRLNLERLVTESAGPRPVVSVTAIQESPGGNGDGIHNPGETLALNFVVANRGSSTATDITASLSSTVSNSRFNLLESNVQIGTLQPGQSSTLTPPFQVSSLPQTPTPYAEEMVITLRHGSPVQESQQRVTLYLYTSSSIRGRITDAGTGAGLGGAAVRIHGPSTVTVMSESDGNYHARVIDGTYQVSATATGYVPSAAREVQVPPGKTGIDLALGVPRLELNPPTLEASMFTKRPITRLIELRNRGSVPLVWSLQLVNGHLGSSGLPQRLVSLPQRTLALPSEQRDGGPREAFKLSDHGVAAALEAPLGTLDGMTIGMLNTYLSRDTLVADLESRGADVVMLSPPLSVATLDAMDVIVVDDAIATLSETDLSRLRNRLSAGAGVLCEADNSTSITSINQLFASTGVTAQFDGFRDLTLTDIRAHPMTEGVSSLQEIAVGASATLSGQARLLVMDPNGRAHAAVTTLGSGTLVFIGNEITDDSNYVSGDGRRFANQIIDHLVARPGWLTLRTTSGTLSAGAAQTLTADLGTLALAAGTYQATILFASNDPSSPSRELPVTLQVRDAPQIQLSKTALAFGSVVEGVGASESFSITNRGTQPLSVGPLSFRGPDAAAFAITGETQMEIPVGAGRPISVTFANQAARRVHTAQLVIPSNDPQVPEVLLPVTGARQLPPDIAVTPNALFIQLRQGETGVLHANLENKGTGPLAWQAALGHEPGRSGIRPTWAVLTGVSGISNPKTRGQLRLLIDTGLLPPGDHTTTLQVASQDVDTPLVVRPVTLRVIAAPRPSWVTSQVFEDTVVGTRRQMRVAVSNLGAAPLTLSSAMSLSTAFACVTPMPLTIPGSESREVVLEFRPTRVAAVSGNLLFGSNTAGRFLFLTLGGRGIQGPTLQLTPASVAVNTAPGVPQQRTILLTNSGALDLSWTAAQTPPVTWFTMQPSSGTLAAGKSVALTLNFVTEKAVAAAYVGQLTVASNDSRRPSVRVPVRMTVSRAATLVMDPPTMHFQQALAGSTVSATFTCRNTGNLPAEVSAITSSRPELISRTSLPATLAPGASVPMTFDFTPTVMGGFLGALNFKTDLKPAKTLTLPVTATVVMPPTLELDPTRLEETLTPGELVTREIFIRNRGGVPLQWTASLRDLFGPAGTLERVLENFNASPGALTALLSNGHTLTEGRSGDRIVNGGNGMFAEGNIHRTNLNEGAALPYADNAIATHASVGASGRYVTRVFGPLFLFAADLDQATTFSLSGGLGTAGAGSQSSTTFTRVIAGITYRGFFKSVWGAGTPSVNHLIIVEDRPGLQAQAAESTASDFFEITGLSGRTRLYHLLFGLNQGAAVPSTTAPLLMESFLRQIVHPSSLIWLTPDQGYGSSGAGGTSSHAIQLDARTLPGGRYTATLRFNSNAVSPSQADLPVTLHVPAQGRLVATPAALAFSDTFVLGSSRRTCTLSNPGNLPVTLTEVRSSDAAINVSGLALPLTLAPRSSAVMTVTFQPTEVRAHPSTLTLISNATNAEEVVVPITARSLRGPVFGATPSSVQLSITPGVVATPSFTLRNLGDATLQWSVTRSANLASMTTLSAAAGSLSPGATQSVTLTVSTSASTASGNVAGGLSFTTNDLAQPSVTVPVTLEILAKPRLGFMPPVSVDFGDVFLGTTATQTLQLRNDGNSALSIVGIRSTVSRFDWVAEPLPFELAPGSSRTIRVSFSPETAMRVSGELEFETLQPGALRILLPIAGRGIVPPRWRVASGGIHRQMEKGSLGSAPLMLGNDGGSPLNWQVKVVDSSVTLGSLDEVLDRVNASHAMITQQVPDLHSFSEGETGSFINDGGNDMYDGGNYLNTQLASGIAYADNTLLPSAAFGPQGRYFTRKHPGLFVLVADMQDITRFSISGNLGADGQGLTNGTVLTRSVQGVTYKGFFKGVSGTTDPSVNHLIIVEDKPGISHTYSTNTDNDEHQVTGLSGSTRLYYLLFSRQNGGQVSAALAGNVMDAVLNHIALPAQSPWVRVLPESGTLAAGAESDVAIQFDTRRLAPATYTATARFTSNAPINSTVDIPLSLEVTPSTLSVMPQTVSALQLRGTTGRSHLQITAEAGSEPAWTLTSSVPWILFSKSSGQGSEAIDLSLSDTLPVGVHAGIVTLGWNGLTQAVPVSVTVRAADFTQLLTDYRQPRILGLIRGTQSQSSLLASVNATTLAIEHLLALPTDITDADLTTDGRHLYAISTETRSISEVNLDDFTLTTTKTIPTPLDAGIGSPYRYHLETARQGLVLYTDAEWQPALHLFDFDAGSDLSSFVMNTGTGIGDFVVTPDGAALYAWTQNGWNLPGSVALARVSIGATTLSQSVLSTALISQSPLEAPIFFTTSRDAVITKDARFNSALTSRTVFTGRHVIAASAYGDALVSGNVIFDSQTQAVRQTLPVSVSVAAFSGDQTALIFLNSTTQQLQRVEVPGLPDVQPAPGLADGSLVMEAPSSLSWKGNPLAASYDVFFGTDFDTVNAATQATPGIFRGNTPGISFSIGSLASQPGQTYYWRVDARNFDGSRVKGTVWSFRLPSVMIQPARLLSASLRDGPQVQATLSLMAGQGSTPWTLAEDSPWLSLSNSAGTGSVVVTATLNPAGLATGMHTTTVTVSSGGESFALPVSFRILEALNILKMEADPSLPWVYALHRETVSPFDSWLLWINPASAQVESLVEVGPNAVDFCVHDADDRLYALVQGGSSVVGVQRQTSRQIVSRWSPSTTARGLYNGPVGRVVLQSTGNVLQMHQSVSGGTVGTSISLPSNSACGIASGSRLFAAVQQSPTVTGLVRYALDTGGISLSSSLYWVGTLTPPLVVAKDGTRAFVNATSFEVSSVISIRSSLPVPVVSSAWNGRMAWSTSQAYQTDTAQPLLGPLPVTTEWMAATPQHDRLVLFDAGTRQFLARDPGALLVTPRMLEFGSIAASSSASVSLTLVNQSRSQVTVDLAASTAELSWPTPSLTFAAGETKQVLITCRPAQSGARTGTLTLSVVDKPEWTISLGWTALASSSTAGAAALSTANHVDTLDLDGDAQPDVWWQGVVVSERQADHTRHHLSYQRRQGISLSEVMLMISRDGQVWSSLTGEVTQRIEPLSSDPEQRLETVTLSVATESGVPWQFRLIRRP